MTGMELAPSAGLIRDEVYRRVIEWIVAGRFASGAVLSERRLAAEFGVSRMPVKEAMRRLENEGFVRTVPRRGIVVAASAQDSAQGAVEVRAALEGLAANLLGGRVAAGTAPADLPAELAAITRAMRSAARRRDVGELREVNARFHEIVRTRCGNAYVPSLSAPVLAVDAAVRGRALADLAEMRRGVREHLAVVRFVLDGDAAAAEQAMRAHILRAGAFVLHDIRAAPDAGGPPRTRTAASGGAS